MTKDELKAALDDAGIDYTSTMKKAELEALLNGGNSGGRQPVDIPIDIRVKTPDGNTHKATYTIVSAHTAIIASQINNGQALLDNAKKGLVDRFGVNYVK